MPSVTVVTVMCDIILLIPTLSLNKKKIDEKEKKMRKKKIKTKSTIFSSDSHSLMASSGSHLVLILPQSLLAKPYFYLRPLLSLGETFWHYTTP